MQSCGLESSKIATPGSTALRDGRSGFQSAARWSHDLCLCILRSIRLWRRVHVILGSLQLQIKGPVGGALHAVRLSLRNGISSSLLNETFIGA